MDRDTLDAGKCVNSALSGFNHRSRLQVCCALAFLVLSMGPPNQAGFLLPFRKWVTLRDGPALGLNLRWKSGIVRSESKGCCTFSVAIGLITGLLLIFPQVN
jgi:hypothetical protein